MSQTTQTIKIGPRFFQIEKKNYSNWRSALVREALQNSIDSSGCSRIDIITEKLNNSTTKLTFADNGAGMSKETLLNVFLVMGETGKVSEDSIGGYGKARVLLCWAQNNYTISSYNYILTGCGAEYNITDTTHFYNGCKFEIETDDSDWENIILRVLNKSSIKQSVYLNGVKHVTPIHHGRFVRELSFADVYVNKSANAQLLVRVGGCWMFSKYLHSSVKAQICVELNPNNSRESMTANRDGLQSAQDDELQSFLNELACDSRSSLKDKLRHFTRLVNRGTGFKVKPLIKKENKYYPYGQSTSQGTITGTGIEQKITVLPPSVGTKLEVSQETEKTDFERFPETIGISYESVESNFCDSAINPVDFENLPSFSKDPLLEAMMILNESNDSKKVQLINNFYHPEKWTTRNGTRYQLLREWFAVCRIVMDEVANWTGNEFDFSIGWVFSDDDKDESNIAKWVLQDGINYLLINPIDKDNKLKYGVNNKNDWYALLTYAAHEATHAAGFSYHDENFSSFFTSLQVKVLARKDEIFTAIKEAKNN